MTDLFLILDTESSLCKRMHRRVLVSLAYEVVDTNNTRHAACYDVVSQPDEHVPDDRSLQIHGIAPDSSRQCGRPLHEVLQRFFAYLDFFQPDAVVGHDVVSDINLIVSEALCTRGFGCGSIPNGLSRLVCTRMLTTNLCAIPLPAHTAKRQPGTPAPTTSLPPYKWPSLQESYDILVRPRCPDEEKPGGPPVAELHDARGDVERCRAIFLEVLRRRRE